MKGVQCYELFGGIALKKHAFFTCKNIFSRNSLGVCVNSVLSVCENVVSGMS